jgi:pSer/pThr/pTyr-binding forkhead associated (FHA) protein
MTPKGFLRVIASESGRPTVDMAYPLLPVTSIGRHSGNTIVLNDGFVSGRHAVLAQRESGWWLEDLGSRNGTLLNSLLLTDGAVVSAGDVITVGGVQLRIELPQSMQGDNSSESVIAGLALETQFEVSKDA